MGDSAHWIAQLVSIILIRWIVIFLLDSVIQRLNNPGLAPVVRKEDSATDWINLSPLDSVTGFPNTYPLDSDFNAGQHYSTFKQRGSGHVRDCKFLGRRQLNSSTS